jgi:hypothetical protein
MEHLIVTENALRDAIVTQEIFILIQVERANGNDRIHCSTSPALMLADVRVPLRRDYPFS